MTKPKSLIINTPFVCPQQHWAPQQDGTLEIIPERRPASYEVFDARNNTRRTEKLELVETQLEQCFWKRHFCSMTCTHRRECYHYIFGFG